MVSAGAAAAVCDVAAGHRDPRAGGRSLSCDPGLAAGAPTKLAVRIVVSTPCVSSGIAGIWVA